MKKLIPLLITIIIFSAFQLHFSKLEVTESWIPEIEETVNSYMHTEMPVNDLQSIFDWKNYNEIGYVMSPEYAKELGIKKKTTNYMPIYILFQTIYGYIFLTLFAIGGVFIKPRKLGVPIAIGVYLVLALLFTFI